MGNLVATQQRFQRVHEKHLNTDKFSENVHFHLRVTADNDTAQQSIARPFALSFSRSRRGLLDRLRLICRELGTEVSRAPCAASQPLGSSFIDHVNFSHTGTSVSCRGRYPSRYRLISRSCVFIGICRDTKVSGQFPIRGVSQFFRCEAPCLLRRDIECRITPSVPA